MWCIWKHFQDAGPGFFFIQSIQEWKEELQKLGLGLGHNGISACHKLQMLNCQEKSFMLHSYGIHAEYLVEVFKYPVTRNCIQPSSEDGYGMVQMIRLYGLVEPYSIVWITTTQYKRTCVYLSCVPLMVALPSNMVAMICGTMVPTSTI